MRMKLLLVAVGTAVLTAALVTTHARKRDDITLGDAPIREPIEIAAVELRDLADVYAADAVIEAMHAATVSAQIAGNVTR